MTYFTAAMEYSFGVANFHQILSQGVGSSGSQEGNHQMCVHIQKTVVSIMQQVEEALQRATQYDMSDICSIPGLNGNIDSDRCINW